MANKTIRLTESQLRGLIKEALNELDYRTYLNAAKKAKKFRDENPYTYDRNRGHEFDNAAMDAFIQQYGLKGQYDKEGRNSRNGTINLNSFNGEPELTGTRNHDFGDGDEHGLGHNVYHMSKKYGTDGKYGRTRMWDTAHETTPEEYYDDEEMGKKFRQAEKDIEDYKSGKSKYVKGKGWTNESKLNELKWQTYQKASNKREKQGKHDEATQLRRMAKQRFDDEFVGDLQYDTMGDKMTGKTSPKFQSNFSTSKPSIEAVNQKGDHLTHHRVNGTDRHYDSTGRTTPEKFFKNQQVSNAYNKARTALNKFNEQHDDFTYSDSEDLGRGRHRQFIIFNGKEIGYLVSIEKNILAPVEEIYVLPDVEYGMQEGWIDFKRFHKYEEALQYARNNFEEIAYLFEDGDYD